MPHVGHRLLGHADLALLLARAVGLDRGDAVHLGAQADVLQRGRSRQLAQLAHPTPRSTSKRSAMTWSGSCSSKICTVTESVSVKSSLIFGKSFFSCGGSRPSPS